MELDRKRAARVLREIATLLEVHGGNPHRVRAFANASRALERFEGDLGAAIADGSILGVKGIGRGTAAVLEELAAGTEPAVLADLVARTPPGVRELLTVRGLGPKKVRALWRDLGVTGPGELEYACLENRLVGLPGFGPASQEKILQAVRFVLAARERTLIDVAWETAEEAASAIRDVPGIREVSPAGEVRRGCATVGAVEIVCAADDPGAAGEGLGAALPEVRPGDGGGWTWRSPLGPMVRIRIVPPSSFGAALLAATGAPAHVAGLARRARAGGLVLDAAGLWSGGDLVAGDTEASIYERLGLPWIPPELREGEDELEWPAGRLAELVSLDAFRGALHNHTTASDGAADLATMAAAAAGLGWSFLGIADHSPAAGYANGLSCERLREQWAEIDALNAAGEGPVILRGLEADILPGGGLDIPSGCEDGLEYVVASVHSSFRLPEEAQTERIITAVRHPACTVLGHPTGMLRLARPGYAVDLERVLAACAEHGVVVEINANPHRLDLDWRWARRALELGLKLAVNPDAHHPDGLGDVRWGALVARKAGASARDVVNTMSVEGLRTAGVLREVRHG